MTWTDTTALTTTPHTRVPVPSNSTTIIHRTASSQTVDLPFFVESTSSTQLVPWGSTVLQSALGRLGRSVALSAAVLARFAQSPTSSQSPASRSDRRMDVFGFTGSEDPSIFTPDLVWPSRHLLTASMMLPDMETFVAEAPVPTAIRWLREMGLPKTRLSSLLEVSRPSIDAWESGASIPHEGNRQRLLAVRDILERAHDHLPNGWSLTDWLDTPRGSEGVTPAALLTAGDWGWARLLAMSSISPGLMRKTRLPISQPAVRFRRLVEPRQTALGPEPSDEPALEEQDEE